MHYRARRPLPCLVGYFRLTTPLQPFSSKGLAASSTYQSLFDIKQFGAYQESIPAAVDTSACDVVAKAHL